jgi:hypothetical protein
MVATGPSSLSAWELLLLAALFGAVFILIAALFPRVDIVRLQLAGSADRAKAIVDGWAREGRLGAARLNVYLDLPFLVTYSTLLALAVVLALRSATATGLVSGRADELGTAFVLAAVTAGACDAIENGALFGMLRENARISEARARTVWALAVSKFALATAVVAWSIGVLVASAIYWIFWG